MDREELEKKIIEHLKNPYIHLGIIDEIIMGEVDHYVSDLQKENEELRGKLDSEKALNEVFAEREAELLLCDKKRLERIEELEKKLAFEHNLLIEERCKH
jgi:hypothetical protein